MINYYKLLFYTLYIIFKNLNKNKINIFDVKKTSFSRICVTNTILKIF